ncbi:PQQ-dependent sugar dehydrogenase [Aeoliella sp.]|uniref:PQQ-dependent sugar dehydrogenase n=1 Tax=Aeoliella sp. TaxID=2795800 RepID=UPI003CCBDDF6
MPNPVQLPPRLEARRLLAMITLLACFLHGAALAVTPPPVESGDLHVRLETIAAGLDSVPSELLPIDLAEFPDQSGRLLVGTFGGTLRVIDETAGLLPDAFMTQGQTNNSVIGVDGDHGLTSVMFHPDFADTVAPGYGKLYTITSELTGSGTADFGAGSHHQNVIREWDLSAGGNTIGSNTFLGSVANSREVLRFDQPGPFHNVSDLAFDDDAYLYIAVGDGGSNPSTAQNVNTALGSVLKIDPLDPTTTATGRGAASNNNQYRIPSDNPFVGASGLDEVWAYGLRSPWRLNFDSMTGDLWVGDVGAGRREEVDLVQRGDNHGWSTYEGTAGVAAPDSIVGFTFPVLEYDRDEGVTVIGGFVYRGSAIPALQGKYVFGELGQGLPTSRLFYGEIDPQADDYGTIYEFQIDPTGALFPGDTAGSTNLLPDRIISIGEDSQGELYIIAGQDPRTHTPSAPGGFVIRIDPAAYVPGDLNGDGVPFQYDDFHDVMLNYLISSHPTLDPAETALFGDFDRDLDVDEDDFRYFKQRYLELGGSVALLAVPEPPTVALVGILFAVLLYQPARRTLRCLPA